MSEKPLGRKIEIYSIDTAGPLWVVTDTSEPNVGDAVYIEQSDNTVRQYEVKRRAWITAKQGESSFSRLRLFVEHIERN